MKKELHWSYGKELGKLIVSVAREKLIYEYNPDKALEVIIESLIGCSEDIALKILSGEYSLELSEDGKSLEVSDKKDDSIDFNSWISIKLEETKKEISGWEKSIQELKKLIVEKKGVFEFSVDYKTLIGYLYDPETFQIDLDDNEIPSIRIIISEIKNLIWNYYKLEKTIKWLIRKYPGEVLNVDLGKITSGVVNLNNLITQLYSGDKDIDYSIQIGSSELLSESDVEEETFGPSNILDGYNAGWLSPEGIFYGMNGPISDMLHLQISDNLQKFGIIDVGNTSSPDTWLATHGWVKIHGNHILYDGYLLPGEKPIHMTEKQRDQIVKYGQVCCEGLLYFGYAYKPISAALFEMIEPLMIRKLFDFNID